MTAPTAAWFELDGEAAVPHPWARAPWAEDMLHGRTLAGLAAREVESAHLDEGWFPARMTIDLFRSPAMAPVTWSSERIRDGGRVRVVDVRLENGGREVAAARVLLVRSTDRQIAPLWTPPPWDLAHPDELDPPADAEADGEAIWQFRHEPDRFINGEGAGRCWTRDRAQLVAGEDVTPFVRVATAADLASPIANSGPGGLDFINADITLNLARLPASDWIGFETLFHENANGVAAATCVVHDLEGAIGLSSVSALLY